MELSVELAGGLITLGSAIGGAASGAVARLRRKSQPAADEWREVHSIVTERGRYGRPLVQNAQEVEDAIIASARSAARVEELLGEILAELRLPRRGGMG